MKIYSEILTREDITRELQGIDSVAIESLRQFSPRKGGRGYEIYLEGYGERHMRARNGREGHAATWDDYGVWMARLYEIDPDARIAWYQNEQDFEDKTLQYIPRGCKAPWLSRSVARPYQWPNAAQAAEDARKIERKRKREIRSSAARLKRQADAMLATL